MARITLLTIVGVLALVGCAPRESMVKNIPAPNFNGPAISPHTPSRAPEGKSSSNRRPPQLANGIPRDWVPAAGSTRAWKWIIIHHSATPSGSARSFDRMHREKGWDELGYHFVIGNGTESGDGQVEVGTRWTKQKWGAHAKTADNRFNDYGIGICLVGNFDIERPTPQQSNALARLVAYLMKTYRIPPERVLGHSDTKPTDCPGRNMNVAAIRRMASQMTASVGDGVADADLAGSLLSDEGSLEPGLMPSPEP